MRRLCLLLLLAASSAAAQTAPAVPNLTGSTRALGLGGAYPINGTDSDAIFYNPAYGERLRGASLAVHWAGSRATLYTLSTATDWFGGALGFGVMAVDYPATVELPMLGSSSDFFREGDVATSERAALLTYARRLKGLRLALTGKLLEQRVQNERNVTAAADIGTVVNVSRFTLGLAAQNLGPGIEVDGRDYDLPMRALLSASSQAAPVGPLDVSGALQVGYTIHGEVIPAGGLEISYWPVSGRTFSVRLGGRRPVEEEEPWTLGAGFSGDKIMIDYAYEPFSNGNVHRVGVRWR